MRPNHSLLSLVVFLLPQELGRTALIRGFLYGHVNVVEKLLAADANHDHEDKVRNLVTRVMLIYVLSASVRNKVLHLFLGQYSSNRWKPTMIQSSGRNSIIGIFANPIMCKAAALVIFAED